MKRTPSLLLAVLTPFLIAVSGMAHSQNCANGKVLYSKTNANVPQACSNAGCHKSLMPRTNNANNILNGSAQPSTIETALDTKNEMLHIRSGLGLTTTDVEDIANWIFYAPNCPAATPALAASPASVSFGSVTVGTPSSQQVTVTNTGTGNATGLTYGAINSKFAVTKTCGAAINAGATCTITFVYTPTAAGSDTATYTITGGGGLSIALSGAGAVATTPANLQATPGSVAFGNVIVGSSSSAQAISIRNLGTTGATSVTFANSNSPRFAISEQSCTPSLAGSATCGFNLTYTPSAVISDTGSITVGYAGGSVIIGLSGAGTAATPPPPPPPPTAQTVNLIEYFHAAFGHYFVTYLQAEIDKLDNGTFAGWVRTGKQFKAWTSPGTGLSPVCRFFTNFIDFAPKSSHFYTPDAPECTVVQANNVWQYEGQVFYTQQPSVTGVCPPNTVPVYRMYNNGQSGAPNHRYTTDLSVRAAMIAVTKTPAPWIPEGAGTLGVIMCAPP